ncbi:HdeD family acid-resistance protein [Allobaculum fili]|uniref:HdeD family acid-resistance protein n=1 Tax=Allobaculum fili TaxID=2834460 RepID=UPI001E4A75B3|nr:DUF308 domain-containing protein [Allobaculum fili]
MKRYMFNFNVKDTLVLALLYLLCGLALCFFQGSILTTVVRIIGIVLIAYGAYMLYVYFGVHKSADTAPMFSGVPSLVLGLIMVCWPHTIINFIPIIVGVLLVINSIVQIQSSLVLKSYGASSWVFSLVVALCLLALGIFLVIKPGSIIDTIMTIAGVALIVQAVVLCFDAFATRKSR